MALGGVDLNLLVILQALLEEGNLTRAGMRVGIPQPAMSTALARLRRHYKDELLLRTGNEYVLTPLARSLLSSVQESILLINHAFSPEETHPPPMSGHKFTISLSDYSLVMLSELLLTRVRELAPEVILELQPVSVDMPEGSRGLLQQDLLIAPEGFWPGGRPEIICRDRFVCVVDPDNPRLRDGRLSLADLAAMPHAVARLPRAELDPVQAELDRLGITRDIAVTTASWLPLPFVVAGTDMVATVPERLARRMSQAAGVTVTTTPFGEIELAEAVWWHPARATDPALAWLRYVLREIASLDAGPGPPRLRRRSRVGGRDGGLLAVGFPWSGAIAAD
jgi:DNA-binding transcriptional LysR family regulator